MSKHVPSYSGVLREHALHVPKCISDCTGIRIFGRRIKSLVFSTDVAILKNINGDAVMAVYPFTPQSAITQAIIHISDVPVFVGVGGGLTSGSRSVRMAMNAEHQGAFGVVVNAPVLPDVIARIKEVVELPVVYTVVSELADVQSRLDAGADILNVSGGAKTPQIVAQLRRQYPTLPIIATGGPTEASIRATIAAGANAITYTPPGSGELFSRDMDAMRAEYRHHD